MVMQLDINGEEGAGGMGDHIEAVIRLVRSYVVIVRRIGDRNTICIVGF